MSKLIIRKAAVLGAGVMGAQIAAHLANADIPVLLFDLPAKEGDGSAIAAKAIQMLSALEPAPLASRSRLKGITPAHYGAYLPLLAECDLVIEAVAERMAVKNALYAQIAPFLKEGATVASNTSGLSINALAENLPEALRPYFCGIHFFNPPRYMKLVEIIPATRTDMERMDALEGWLTTRLGKGVIRALDTPNFIANRIGVFSMLCVMHHTQGFGLGFDTVDALTGQKIGRPKSATYRTADLVGLDTLAHAIQTMQDGLPDDPWRAHFQPPAWLKMLVSRGALGQKTGCGIFRRQGKAIQVLDLAAQDYRPASRDLASEVVTILDIRNPTERFAALRHSAQPQAQFLWAIFRDIFHYSAVHLEQIAHQARDLDFALRWGFGWSQGPFETWQAIGWADIAHSIQADIAADKTMSAAALPDWVFETGRTGVHRGEGSYAPRTREYVARPTLAVYQRQIFPDRLLGEDSVPPEKSGETRYENDGVRLWVCPEQDDKIGILSFKSKKHTVGGEVLDGLLTAVRLAEEELEGLVIWHSPPFSYGANLPQVVDALAAGAFDQVEGTVTKFQQASQTLKYAQIPIVAAVQDMALGGGCEFVMHAVKRVLALESYIGLVETGVGLIPAGGGCKEFALRAAQLASQTATPGEVLPFLQPIFQNIAMAKVSKSAWEAVEMGFAQSTDRVLFNASELLFAALREARTLADTGYRPPLAATGIPVAGKSGIAAFDMMLVNMREGGMISAHDYRIGHAVAVALCGGEIEAGSLVDEPWLLAVERRLFLDLLKTPETLARIKHTLETGKPLRN